MLTNESRSKTILSNIPLREDTVSDTQSIITLGSHTIDTYELDQLIHNTPEANTLAQQVKEYTILNRPNFSNQQINFTHDVTKLIYSEQSQHKPIIIPVRCGFGKSTIINSILHNKIKNELTLDTPSHDIGMVIVTERLEDLQRIQEEIRNSFGYYHQFQYRDSKGGLINEETDWLYIIESWNKKINCRKNLDNYEESISQCRKCEFLSECKIGKQHRQQVFSPIVGITTTRLYTYMNNGNIDSLGNWTYKRNNTESLTLKRNILLIDEKPKLTRVESVTKKTIEDMINRIREIPDRGSHIIRNEKSFLEFELDNVKMKLSNVFNQHEKYRNAYLKLEEIVFTDDFMNTWNRYFKHDKRLVYTLETISNAFNGSSLYCRTGKYDILKSIHINEFNTNNYKTFIFDGTAEMSLEYDKDDFIFLNANSYRDYPNTTFHFVDANFSKSSLEDKSYRLDAVSDWINNNVKDNVYVVTYKEHAASLQSKLKDNKHIVLDQVNSSIPYFGATKGKNTWNECKTMIQVGWNRWDSDSYISNAIASDKELKLKMDNGLVDKYDFVQGLLSIDNKGQFWFKDFEQYKLMQIMNDFEQEVFRTAIREFSSYEKIDIYIFGHNPFYEEVLRQRFTNCEIKKEKWIEIELNEKKNRKSSKGKGELTGAAKFITWLETWNREDIEVKEIKKELSITDSNWSKTVTKDKDVISLLHRNSISIKRKGKNYYLTLH